MRIPFFKKNPFRKSKKTSTVNTEKGFFPWGEFAGFLEQYNQTDLAAYAALNLFSRTAPFNTAVTILAEEFSGLIPIIKDEKKDENINDHPVLELLKQPNADSTRSEFFYAFASYYLITGNSYTLVTGDIHREPVEIMPMTPQYVNLYPSGKDIFLGSMVLSTTTQTFSFKREETINGFRFYYSDDFELWQTKRFNPNTSTLSGQSLATPVFPEIDQYNESSEHNSSLLKRGGRPSGVLLASAGKTGAGSVAQPLSDAQYKRLKEQTTRFMAGSQNAGRILLAEGAHIDYKDMMTSNRDMDFLNLKNDVRQAIYNQYQIPLPFVNPERQTFANMGLAKEQLYDNAVLPLANRLFEELGLLLLPRYKNSENLKLTYDQSAIPALKARKTRELLEKRKTGIYTTNELRELAGKERLSEGGDMLYRPASDVPVAMDQYILDQYTRPQSKLLKSQFEKEMLNRGYEVNKIKSMMKYLKFD